MKIDDFPYPYLSSQSAKIVKKWPETSKPSKVAQKWSFSAYKLLGLRAFGFCSIFGKNGDLPRRVDFAQRVDFHRK